jgi:hypothetical protein
MADTTKFGSSATFASGAVSDLFAGFAAAQNAKLAAAGLNLQAGGLRIKAEGDIAEAQSYDLASALASANKQYTIESTTIQQAQLDRQINQTIGSQQAGTAGAGLAASGSALDILADSASQGALAHEVLAKQGLITEAGYDEQAKSYDVMAGAARMAAAGEMSLAAQTDTLAQQTVAAGQKTETMDFISSAAKGAAAIGMLMI